MAALLREAKLLDHGFVQLIDVMGDDQAIVDAARVSVGLSEELKKKKLSTNRGLIRYLMRKLHTSPFEMVEFKFICKMPIFVARQWIRHRTANVNEVSGRYSILPEEFYLPKLEDVQYQDPKNRQMRGAVVPPHIAQLFVDGLHTASSDAFELYRSALGKGEIDPAFQEVVDNGGIAHEIARLPLPLNTYTAWYWKIDLHNLLHFIQLRMDPHAQMEIRVFAEAMYAMVKEVCPLACEAFEDFRVNAITLTSYDINHIRAALMDAPTPPEFPTTREHEEFLEKAKRLGLLINTEGKVQCMTVSA